MDKLLPLVVVAVIALAVVGLRRSARTVEARLERLRAFFESKEYGAVDVSLAEATYGHPGYLFVFETAGRMKAFRSSDDFAQLVNDVAAMHVDRKGFDANLAVQIESR